MIPNSIAKDIAKIAPQADPQLVYGYLLLAEFRFSEISRRALNREIRIAAECVSADPEQAARVAASYGLGAA